MVYLQDQNQIGSVAGYRFQEYLAWRKILYIDDLVTPTIAKKKGYGGALLKWIIEQAREQNCQQVHLDSGYARHDAHRLYLNHGFRIMSHHFALDLSAF